jgi:thiamine biosynthesis lipoprotein
MKNEELVRKNRRQTLAIIVVLLIVTPLLILLFNQLGKGSGYLKEPYRRSEYVLDDTITMVLYGEDKQKVEAAAEAAFLEIRRLDEVFNRQNPRSELAAVNRDAHAAPVRVSDDLFTLLKTSQDFNVETGGAFDPTLGPIIDLWDVVGRRSSGQGPPSDAEIEAALARCGSEYLKLDEAARTVYLAREGMILDLGGSAKGYAADAAKRVLESQGVKSGFVDMISTTVTIGDKPREADGPNWRIGMSNPRAAGENMGLITVQGDFYLSTSGDYQRFFEYGGVRYHHIFNPATGRPATGTISDSVLILSPRELGGTETDILSTAFFVMGYPRAIEWAQEHGYELALIDSAGNIHTTHGMADHLELYVNSINP